MIFGSSMCPILEAGVPIFTRNYHFVVEYADTVRRRRRAGAAQRRKVRQVVCQLLLLLLLLLASKSGPALNLPLCCFAEPPDK